MFLSQTGDFSLAIHTVSSQGISFSKLPESY
jgi:hypothetical protein